MLAMNGSYCYAATGTSAAARRCRYAATARANISVPHTSPITEADVISNSQPIK